MRAVFHIQREFFESRGLRGAARDEVRPAGHGRVDAHCTGGSFDHPFLMLPCRWRAVCAVGYLGQGEAQEDKHLLGMFRWNMYIVCFDECIGDASAD